MTTPLASLVFIGDRPAQLAALVLDASVTYTSDRADPFMVQRLVESYLRDRLDDDWQQGRRRVVLSTGLTWAPKYDGMAARQVNTLVETYVNPLTRLPPYVYVLPVSTSYVLGHSLNEKLDEMCDATARRRNNALFLGGAHPLWNFTGDVNSPLSPTPVEVLALADVLKTLIELDQHK